MTRKSSLLNHLRRGAESADPGTNFMDLYPNWLIPQLPLPSGTYRDPHITYDEPDEYETERRLAMKQARKKIPTT